MVLRSVSHTRSIRPHHPVIQQRCTYKEFRPSGRGTLYCRMGSSFPAIKRDRFRSWERFSGVPARSLDLLWWLVSTFSSGLPIFRFPDERKRELSCHAFRLTSSNTIIAKTSHFQYRILCCSRRQYDHWVVREREGEGEEGEYFMCAPGIQEVRSLGRMGVTRVFLNPAPLRPLYLTLRRFSELYCHSRSYFMPR